MSYTRRDDILRDQRGATTIYLLAMVEPVEVAGRFVDGFELFHISATFHAEIQDVIDRMIPALVNGFAMTARAEDRLREERQREEEQLMRPMVFTRESFTRDQLVAAFGADVADQVMGTPVMSAEEAQEAMRIDREGGSKMEP